MEDVLAETAESAEDVTADVPPPPTQSDGPEAVKKERPLCKYGDECRSRFTKEHCQEYSHPTEDFSQDGDQHAGTKFPRMRCRSHPGCPARFTCFYSHGLIQSACTLNFGKEAPKTCFLGQAPHNGNCHKPTWNGEAFEFCSQECRKKAQLTPKGPLGCRRADCKCPVTVSGVGGQFCCEVCMQGKPCKQVTHTLPVNHLVVVAAPQAGKYAPCSRPECACSSEKGSSWDGEAGEFCCRACRNGTPCTKLWHTVPAAVAAQQTETKYEGCECALEGCSRPTWNGQSGEYCCVVHRHMGLGNADVRLPASSAGAVAGAEVAAVDVPTFPNYDALFRNAETWARACGSGANRGKVAAVWKNASFDCPGCPARISFERAARQVGLEDWDDGEFGWHGTKAIEFVKDICWNNWATHRRSGQACGPGEYFSRGTLNGLHYSEGYAGGTAGNLLIVAWIMAADRGAAPTNPAVNGAGAENATGHIVVQNPTTDGKRSTGEMYCFPIAVVAFGNASPKPDFTVDHKADASDGYQLSAAAPWALNDEKKGLLDSGDQPSGAGSKCCSIL